jgi:hypothetical protein
MDTRRTRVIYTWAKRTKEFNGTGISYPDPYDPKSWSMPSNATMLEPPVQRKGYVSIWNGAKWEAIKRP